MRIALIGAGLIGQSWAIVFARAGYQVALWDGHPPALPNAMELISQQVHTLHTQNLIDDPESTISAILPLESLEECVDGAMYVQENLPEQLEIKRNIFGRLDSIAHADAILASSTSSIPASKFTEELAGRTRCLVAHPVNPPYLIPVVELCGSPWTDDSTLHRTRQLMLDIKQKPVVVHGEPLGFILNRLQGALLREAFRLIQHGHISAEDLDVTVKDGLGLRWSIMGPIETIDLNASGGLSDYCGRYGEMFRSIAEEQTSTDGWSSDLIADVHAQRRAALAEAMLPERRSWRDERLMSLAVHRAIDQ